MKALDERAKKIADGLAAAERGKQDLELATKRSTEASREGKEKAAELIANAEKRAAQLIEEAKVNAKAEADRIVAGAKAEIDRKPSAPRSIARTSGVPWSFRCRKDSASRDQYPGSCRHSGYDQTGSVTLHG